MRLYLKKSLKIFFIYIFSNIYLYIFFNLLKEQWLEDYRDNVFRIIEDDPYFINTQNYLFFGILKQINYIFNDEGITILFLAGISLSIYIFLFLKHKQSIILFLNFIILPITPVFFISINRFALSSAFAILAIDYFYSNKSKSFNKIYILILIFSLFIHIGSIILIILYLLKIDYFLKNLNSRFLKFRLSEKKDNNILVFTLISTFLLIIYISLIKFNLANNDNLFYQFSYLISCIYKSCSNEYSIFIIPFSLSLIVLMSSGKKENYLDIKFRMIISLFLIVLLSFIIPIFWRYWIPCFFLTSKFSQKNIIVPNIILFIYAIYLLPKYITL